jgi:hypothetical protein
MATNSIGSFTFIALDNYSGGGRFAPPLTAAQQLAIVQRPGVNGTAFIKAGTKGEPFQMRSFRDETTLTAAAALIESYKALIGAAPQTIVWAGLDYFALHANKYEVLNVRPLNVQKIAGATGGLSGAPAAICEALWDLIPVVV